MRVNPLLRRPLNLLSLTHRRYLTTNPSSPLRILFCGSDEFSAASLSALHAEHTRNPSLIESIDVVVRPPKPTGRGYKTIRQVPLQSLAEKLSLPIHPRDTFTGWTPPTQPNLIIAVSFGLFVPPRILRAADYGGLNIHPSMLPDLRGPAPLHWALLLGRQYTGVTLQTLSHEDFDKGVVLAQTPAPGIPIPEGCSVPQLRDMLAPVGAEMLVDALRKGLHVPPHQTPKGWKEPKEGEHLIHAGKLKPEHRELFRPLGDGEQWTGVSTTRRTQILGDRAWSRVVKPTGGTKRMNFHGVEAVPREEWPAELARFVEFVKRKAKAQKKQSKFYNRAGVLDRNYLSEMGQGVNEQRMVVWAGPYLAAALEQLKPDEDGKRVEKHGETNGDEWLHRISMTVLPYFPDPENEGAVIMPVDALKGDVVRIRAITGEGERSRPAAGVLWDYSLGLAGLWRFIIPEIRRLSRPS
jgi:methionyl-tRNA formyltransferase